ncbi:TIGR03086 family metal-binding protein [Janibacter sp. G56]|uniref:TIGR03086 family metal-binding protein n=1 Tax=Janibacter sp. G56 TaxID=3418717 RepID=UPI003D033E5A
MTKNAPARYDQTSAPFLRVLDAVPADAWDRPSPCTDWTAAQVVFHVIETQRDFLIRRGYDLPIEAPKTGSVANDWRTHAQSVSYLLLEPRVEEEYDGYFGRTTVAATMADFHGFDMVVHRWDVARAAGLDTTFTEGELDLLEASIATFGDGLHAPGVCGPPVPVAADASRQDRILGALGRDPRWSPPTS